MSEKESEKQLIHPVTAKIVNHMDRANLLLQQTKYVESLKAMRGVIAFMDQKDVPDQLHTKIRQEPYKIQSSESNRQRERHATTSEAAYWKWYIELDQVLYDKGYYTMEKFGKFHDPSKGRKST